MYGIRSTTYPSYALNLAQLGGFVFQIFVQQSPNKVKIVTKKLRIISPTKLLKVLVIILRAY
ncbi:hypothetical protein [Acinetobacter baumannii]|uniref:hypothetical protein n=1 Tax=Acinetobacter baumannii TaxID=470 RepID=UPI003892BD12